jgi:hypothetical protein
MSLVQKGEMSLIPWGYLGWFLCVTGATISSMPQWFIVAMHLPAVTAVELGIPILIIGSIFLIIGWLPERSRKYPEVLENTMTPIPDYYLKQA